MKKIVVLVIVSVFCIHAWAKPSVDASKEEIALYIVQSAWSVKKFEELKEKIAPFLSRSYQKEMSKAITAINKQFKKADQNFEKIHGQNTIKPYFRWNGIKPDVAFKVLYTNENGSVYWSMYEKSSIGGSFEFVKEKGQWKVNNL